MGRHGRKFLSFGFKVCSELLKVVRFQLLKNTGKFEGSFLAQAEKGEFSNLNDLISISFVAPPNPHEVNSR